MSAAASHAAAGDIYTAAYEAVSTGDLAAVNSLLDAHPELLNGCTGAFFMAPLHAACYAGHPHIVLALLSRPGIDVNLKEGPGATPLHRACGQSVVEVLRPLLDDPRVDVNARDEDGWTAMFWAAHFGTPATVKWLIGSRRDIDTTSRGRLGSGFWRTPRETAAKRERYEIEELLGDYEADPNLTRHLVCLELGLAAQTAAETCAAVVFLCDGLLRVKAGANQEAARFFRLAQRLPLELQMMLCNRAYGVAKDGIPRADSEPAFRHLARVCEGN